MKNTWAFRIHNDDFTKGRYYNFKNFKVYLAWRDYVAGLISKFDYQQSFTGQFIKEGFETFGIGFNSNPPSTNLYKKQISPTQNWFGTSLYEPDTYFVKDDKVLLMSLQGVSVPYNEDYSELFRNGAIKYIKMKVKDKVLYETWTGSLPDKETVKQFLND